jgi:hypothetical protein
MVMRNGRYRSGAGVLAIAVVAALPASAGAATTRSVSVKRGVTNVNVRVLQQTGAGPPAILLSTSSAAGRGCLVKRYSYVNRQRYGHFRMAIRCPRARAGARARLVFRAALMRRFRMRNGAGTVRIAVDKPRGNVRPMVQLITHPRDTDCTASRARIRASATRLTATARVRCHDLPANATGELAVGGLIAAHRALVSSASATTAARSAAPTTATHSRISTALPAQDAVDDDISSGCRDPYTISVGGSAVHWRYCYGGSFALGPWEGKLVGFSAPDFGCPDGWTRRFNILEHTAAWLAVGYFNTELVTNPSSAWAWTWRLGLVANWQFSGDIEFSWQYRCFRFS